MAIGDPYWKPQKFIPGEPINPAWFAPNRERSLASEVKGLEDKHREAMHLLGEIVATFSVNKDRESVFSDPEESLRNLFRIADRWKERHDKIKASGVRQESEDA